MATLSILFQKTGKITTKNPNCIMKYSRNWKISTIHESSTENIKDKNPDFEQECNSLLRTRDNVGISCILLANKGRSLKK